MALKRQRERQRVLDQARMVGEVAVARVLAHIQKDAEADSAIIRRYLAR